MAPTQEMARPSKADDAAVTKYHITAQTLATVLQSAIRWGGAIAIVYLARDAVIALAGQTTEANFAIKFLSSVTTSNALGWGTAAAGVGYGIQQKRLRERTIERQSTRISELEKQIDARRSSSKLTSKGRTNPKDKQ